MDKKEITVFIIGSLVVGSLIFDAGMIYSDNKVTQAAIKANTTDMAPQSGLKDYQLDVYNDSTVIWDGDRRVSTLKFDEKQALDSVIMDDNQ